MDKPFNFERPDWTPLERAIALAGCPADEVSAVCDEFMWMCEQPQGVHQYKHRDTRTYIRLTGQESPRACARDLEIARSMYGSGKRFQEVATCQN